MAGGRAPIEITLGERKILVRPFNVGQIEKMAELETSGTNRNKVPFAILRLAFERQEVPSGETAVVFDELEPTQLEIQDALQTILRGSGMEQKAVTPGEATAPQKGA
jgi:hypothetical protein